MSPERKQARVTLEEIISNAKEIMVREGQHVPTLIVEGSKILVAGQIPDMPATHGERMDLLHFLGQAAAQSGRVDQLQQVFMVSEGWMSEPSEDQSAKMPPSQDPNRKEVLIISAIQIQESKKETKLFEIRRDSNQQVVGLEEFMPEKDKKDELVDIPLLDSFVQGFQTAFRTKYN
jgi:hypothetical protein